MKMNIKKLVGILMTSMVITTARADYHGHDLLVEVKGNMFIPTSKKMRDIYTPVMGNFGTEITGQFVTDRGWYGFASADFVFSEGKSLGGNNCTKMFLMPLGFGIKYLRCMGSWDWYLGAGITATLLQTHDYSKYVCCKNSQWAPGGVFKAGINVDVADHFFMDFFANYAIAYPNFCGKCCKEVSAHKVNASGTSIGIGLGYRF